jgi:hypothetical protein
MKVTTVSVPQLDCTLVDPSTVETETELGRGAATWGATSRAGEIRPETALPAHAGGAGEGKGGQRPCSPGKKAAWPGKTDTASSPPPQAASCRPCPSRGLLVVPAPARIGEGRSPAAARPPTRDDTTPSPPPRDDTTSRADLHRRHGWVGAGGRGSRRGLIASSRADLPRPPPAGRLLTALVEHTTLASTSRPWIRARTTRL